MKSSPADLLDKIAAIQQMEPGKLCQMQRGPNTAYYNLQCREQGKTRTQYIPADQVEEVKAHTENYQAFKGLVQDYADQIIDRTRAERLSGIKKKNRARNSSSPRTKRSGN